MPVTFNLAGHQATDWIKAKTKSSDELFAASCLRNSNESQKLIQSSISRRDFRKRHISPSRNGLIWTVFDAYSKLHYLVLRPEDIWLAILCQLSFHINANAEELREYFVSHQGRKKLVVEHKGDMEHADFAVLACRMTDLIQNNVKEPRLREWIMPSFSTTTDCDRTVAAILMMGSTQKYFSFMCRSSCGIPSVTLLGKRKDWENILYRLEYLSELGTEPDTFANLLKPILRGFVASFDAQRSQANTEFWHKMVHRNRMMSGQEAKRSDGQTIDEAIYHNVEEGGPVESGSQIEIPPGYAGLDTVQPLTGWFMHDVGTSA
ncbi:hypothetical protein OPT61_g2018 [Boeremia exigua]|uniref:Uncharacterized protein n=1 Tax=Boeremia exigua TaxID=749465 RepID=A0ACC2IN30_9PLEO|nr:hypothetical protein OPT61_g2018 [Boeremia exigua]